MYVGGIRQPKRFIFNGAWQILTRAGFPQSPSESTSPRLEPTRAVAAPEGGVTYRDGIDSWAFFFWLISGRYPRAFFVANQYGDWINYSAKAAAAGYILNKYGVNKYRAAKTLVRKLWLRQHMKPTPKMSLKATPLTGFGSPFGSAGPTFFLGAPIIINAVQSTKEYWSPLNPIPMDFTGEGDGVAW